MTRSAESATKRRLVITRQLPQPVEARAQRDYTALLNAADRPFTHDDWRSRCTAAEAVLCTPADRLDAEVIVQLPESIRIIATFSVGYEHIDLAAAAARNIVVTNTPDVLTDATADIAMLLLLGAARRASEGEALMRQRAWTGWGPTQLMGTHVGGKALGIVGFGRIGQAVARRAVAFGMRVHCLSRNKRDLPGLETQQHANETTFWPSCQFVSLHLPLTSATRHYLNAARIARLPRGAIVVNTARGDVVDDDALIAALSSGHLAAAGLDVYSGEPNFRAEYAALPNTFLLPHLGSATLETRSAMGFRALDNLDQFFAGEPPADRVTR
ncbi:MAG: D-glycerate dehydrogenase [Pseudomonadales bacterium]|nr:D-glycerate dehydrogenase [Pseudomonadales bacterium]